MANKHFRKWPRGTAFREGGTVITVTGVTGNPTPPLYNIPLQCPVLISSVYVVLLMVSQNLASPSWQVSTLWLMICHYVPSNFVTSLTFTLLEVERKEGQLWIPWCQDSCVFCHLCYMQLCWHLTLSHNAPPEYLQCCHEVLLCLLFTYWMTLAQIVCVVCTTWKYFHVNILSVPRNGSSLKYVSRKNVYIAVVQNITVYQFFFENTVATCLHWKVSLCQLFPNLSPGEHQSQGKVHRRIHATLKGWWQVWICRL